MPTDLSVDSGDRLIRVRDRGGVDMPFSKGLMATSILATGLETGQAHAVAADIEQELRGRGLREIEADELAQFAADTLHRSAGREMADRYVAWRQAKRVGRPLVICLGGAPGVGKSTIATRLALRLGISRVVPSDAIREVLRTVVPDTVLPELHLSTYETFGSEEEQDTSSPTVYLRQSRAVVAACTAVANRLTTERRSVILEGVHLLPGEIRRRLREKNSDAVVVELLLTVTGEYAHREQLSHRLHREPGRDGHRHLQHLPVIRRLQEELRRLARAAGVPEHDTAHPEDLTQRIVDQVVVETKDLATAGVS